LLEEQRMTCTALLLGGSGYIGTAFQEFFRRERISYRNLRRQEVDYTNAAKLRTVLQETKPELVINAAGYTGQFNVDDCEAHKTDCLLANTILPGIIREVCENLQQPWAHISSGCIFTGTHADGSGFTETDEPNFTFRKNNCSFYSGTKAFGEELLQNADRCYVWRLRIPFHHVDHPRNYLTKMLRYERLLDTRQSLTYLPEFVEATWNCWQRRLPFGTYHMTNPGSITTREVVELIHRSGVCKKEFIFFASEKEFMQLAAKTPRSNCILDTSKLQRAGIAMTEVHASVTRALANWKTL